ncbi:MAG: hypothetical protein HGA45_30610 [Chloroflexales bacterium]|nr:hypothetical protein [Chloroflexales bacterium]
MRVAHPAPVWPAERFQVECRIGVLRARLPAALLDAHWREGAALALEQATAEALAPSGAQPLLAPGRAASGLTPREEEVARLVAQGCTNRVIAERW